MWQQVLDSTLNFFSQIGEFTAWLFEPLSFNIPELEDGFWGFLLNWLINWLNSLDLGITPISIFTIGGFLLLISIGVLKLIF